MLPPERDDGSVEYDDDDDDDADDDEDADGDDDNGVMIPTPTPENIVEGMAERTALLKGF